MRRIGIICTVLVLGAVLSCSKKDGGPRIEVLSQDGKSLLKTLAVPVEGGTFTLTAKSKSSLDIFYEQSPDADAEWFKLLDVTDESAGTYLVKFSVAPLESTLDLRNGTLSFSAPSENIGKFLDVRQGYNRIWQETFSKMPDGVLVLAPGESWEGGAIAGISSLKNAYVSFQARVGQDSADEFTPLSVGLLGGGLFREIERDAYVTDVERASSFEPRCFHKMNIYNAGLVFSSESALVLTVPVSAKTSVIIDNLSVYELPADGSDIDAIPDDDEYDDED